MKSFLASGPFVNSALRAIEGGTSFALRLPEWKKRLIQPLIERQLQSADGQVAAGLRSSRGFVDAVRAFFFSPVATVVQIASKSGYVVGQNVDGHLIFTKEEGRGDASLRSARP